MPKNHPPLTAERLREVLSYDPLTGVFLWKVSTGRRVRVGGVAGYLDEDGYLRIRIDGTAYRAHRLAWLYAHGHWPADQLDHRNRVRSENWIDNLREATNAQNHQNLSLSVRNRSGHIGVAWHKSAGKWRARLRVRGKVINAGSFERIEDAVAARAKAKAEYHEFQPCDLER